MAGPVKRTVDPVYDPREDTADRLVARMSRPWMTGALVSTMVLAHLAVGSVRYRRGTWSALDALIALRPPRLLARAGGMRDKAMDRGELWRLVSAAFLHADGLHLLVNAIAIIVLGRVCEAVFGPVRLLWLFLSAAILGSAFSWLLGGTPLSVGASGGAFGMLGAVVVFGWRHRDDLPAEMGRTFRWIALGWVGLNVLLGVVAELLYGASFLDHAAHVGGLLGGCLIAMVSGNVVTRTDPPRRGMTAGLAALCGLLMAWALLGVWGKWGR